jgi:mono/diheme cytochrome c family protein
MTPRSNSRGRSTSRAVKAALSVAAASATIALHADLAGAAGETPAKAYILHCVGCHMEDGMGAEIGQVPPIPGITGHFLKHPRGREYLIHVPGVVNAGLPDDETAAVLNYVLERWAKPDMPADAKPFTAEEVHELRKTKIDDITVLRQQIKDDLAKEGITLTK